MLVSPRCLPWLPLRQLSPPTSVFEVLQHSTCNSCLGCRSKVERWISWSIFSEIVNDRSWNGYSMPTKTHQPTNPLRGFSRTTTAGSAAALAGNPTFLKRSSLAAGWIFYGIDCVRMYPRISRIQVINRSEHFWECSCLIGALISKQAFKQDLCHLLKCCS